MSRREYCAADALRAIGMHPKYKGYAYTLYILELMESCPRYIRRAGMELYAKTAEEFGVSVASVERNIRFAIKRTCENGNRTELERMFANYDIGYVPTNNEFIAVMIECMNNGRVMPVQLSMAF